MVLVKCLSPHPDLVLYYSSNAFETKQKGTEILIKTLLVQMVVICYLSEMFEKLLIEGKKVDDHDTCFPGLLHTNAWFIFTFPAVKVTKMSVTGQSRLSIILLPAAVVFVPEEKGEQYQ